MQVKRVLVVGGGSSGWTAAAFLNAALNIQGKRFVDVSLVESPDIPRIGVGEATIPNIRRTIATIGLNELDFMRAVDGTFKQSIRFENWLHSDGHHYHHPFTRYGAADGDDAGRRWLMSNRSLAFVDTVSAQPAFCESGFAPKTIENQLTGLGLNYAYHMDAQKFAGLLTGHATARGVTHYKDNVIDVDVAANGHIAAVITESGARIEADLFVDCTGFAAHLIEKALGTPFEDCSQWLLCDRAITMNVPYDYHYPGRVKPYTTATALSTGWVWDIPLQTRRSLGYVHSSAFIDDDAAEREMRAFEGPHAESLDSRLVRFRVGRRQRQWVGNCVSIGLSGGFIEPLESTGLYLSQIASDVLAEHFPFAGDLDAMAFRFNRVMANRFYEILDFINMHYCLTRRQDTEFWREVSRQERITDRLRAKLEFWKLKPPTISDFEDQNFPGQPTDPLVSGDATADNRAPVDTGRLWNHYGYETILYGMDFLNEECRQRFGEDLPPPATLKKVTEATRFGTAELPLHHEWLQRHAGMGRFETR